VGHTQNNRLSPDLSIAAALSAVIDPLVLIAETQHTLSAQIADVKALIEELLP
jgi:hypothetical protein